MHLYEISKKGLVEKIMDKLENIFLVGLMGAGKTTIGRQLAKSLRWPFYDSDKAIEERTGVDISTIFEFEGEDGFRDREEKMILQLTQMKGIVMATGGGVVIREKNRNQLKKNGFLVYLQCPIDKILERTKHDLQRPLLQTDNPRGRLETLLSQREPLYSTIADLIVDTGNLQSKEVVIKIINAYDTMRNS